MTESPTLVALRSTFIGRERELAEVEECLRPNQPTGRGVALIRGEAGIGKTRLAEELCHRAAQHSEPAYWGRCVEAAGAPAFWPWAQVFRSVTADSATMALATDRERAAIMRVTQEQSAASPRAAAEPSVGWVQAETERFQLFDVLATVLQRLGNRAAFGIVLDDLHVADLPSLLLLDFVARQNPRSFWVIGIYREIEAATDESRRDVIASIARLGRTVSLKGLSQPDVGRLIADAVGSSPAPTMVRRISELTDGNPFFVDEVARLLWPTPEQVTTDLPGQIPVPAGVREVVRQRLRKLNPACLDMLQIAAVIGREVAFPLLREAAAVETPQLLDLIDSAQAIRVLEPRHGQRLAFGHALIRETLYEDLSASARVELHRRVGSAIERLYAESIDEHLAALAYHFARVAPAGDAARALDYAERAARRAALALAYEDAADLYALALESLPLLGGETANRQKIDLLLALGDAYIRAGDTPRARTVFEQAATAARQRRDYNSLARAALGCGGLGLGVPQGTVDRPLVALLEEALAQPADAYPSALRVRLLGRLALELYFSDAVAQRRRLMSEALALAADTDGDTQAYLKHARLVGLWDVTPPDERMHWSEALIEHAQQIGNDDLALRAHSYRLLEIIDTGIADAWEPAVDSIVALGERLREPRFQGMITGTQAMHSVWVGRFADADALGLRALEIAQSVRDLNTPISIAAQSFFMLRLRGEADEVEAAARAIFAGAPTIPGTRCMVILALCGLGRLDEARAEIEQLGDAEFDLLRRANRLASLIPWLSEAAAMVGDRARMQALHRDLLPLAGRNITLQARVCFGPADFYLGILCAGLGRADDALTHFRAAIALATRMRGRPLIALIQVEHARVLLQTAARSEAVGLLNTARATARALGMHAVAKRIDGLNSNCASTTERVAPTGPLPVAEPYRTRHGQVASLRREGSLWTIAAGGTVLRCKPSKGLQYLAQLLRHPGKSFHVAELLALDHARGDASTAERTPLDRLGMHVGSAQEGEPIADAKALASYRSRLEDLAAELNEATGFNDLVRSERIQAEIDVLTQALLGAVGFGGRIRATGSFMERARLNVTRAIRSAIRRIGEGHPELERHLSKEIRTGVFCSYAPPSGEAIRWEL